MGYIFINPIFEANDESGHFQYAFYISKYNRLPSITTFYLNSEQMSMYEYIEKNIGKESSKVFYMDEKYMFFLSSTHSYTNMRHHPPLYYFISSLLIKPFKVNNIYAESNWPYSKRGYDLNVYKNNIIWQNQSQTFMLVLILRMFQLIYGIITIIFIYKILKLLFGNNINKYSILLISSIAFLPQFTFLYSYVNNDALSYLFGLISIYFIILLFKNKKSYFGVFSIIFALIASFTKLTMLILLPLVMLTFFIWIIKNKRKISLLIFLSISILFTIFTFYLIKSQNYSNDYIWKNVIEKGKKVIINFSDKLSIDTWVLVAPKTFKSTIAYFGWFTIEVSNFIYNFYFIYIISGVLLLIINIKKYAKNLSSIIFIIITIVSIFSYFIIYATSSNYAQTAGRIFFLAVILTFILAIVGYNNIKLPSKKILVYSLIPFFIFINVFCLYYHIYLNYY